MSGGARASQRLAAPSSTRRDSSTGLAACQLTDSQTDRHVSLSLVLSFRIGLWLNGKCAVWAQDGHPVGNGAPAALLSALQHSAPNSTIHQSGTPVFPADSHSSACKTGCGQNSPRACDSLPCALCDCERVCGSEQAACCPCSRAARACGLASNCAPSVRLGLCIHASARDANSPAPLTRVPGMCKARREFAPVGEGSARANGGCAGHPRSHAESMR